MSINFTSNRVERLEYDSDSENYYLPIPYELLEKLDWAAGDLLSIEEIEFSDSSIDDPERGYVLRKV